MPEFNDIQSLQMHIYSLFRMLTDSRIDLSKKMVKTIENNILNIYNRNLSLLQFNEKYKIKFAMKRLVLERKMVKKNFNNDKKIFIKEFNKKIPNIKVICSATKINPKDKFLPELSYSGNVTGTLSWDTYKIKPGLNNYAWTFLPDDLDKYSVLHGFIPVMSLGTLNKRIKKRR